jgi:nitroreductase
MDIRECVEKRKSIRGFTNQPVPAEVIEEILAVSVRSPSSLNTQPWEFVVAAGGVLDEIRDANVERYNAGIFPDEALRRKHRGVYRERQVALAKQLFALMEIKREDRQAREEWARKGIRFFDAPAALIIVMDEAISGAFAFFDLGIVTQTICLTAVSFGLGTCIETQGVMYPEVIRAACGIPDTKNVVMGIALGYPDWEHPANRIATGREPAENITIWRGFDGKTV